MNLLGRLDRPTSRPLLPRRAGRLEALGRQAGRDPRDETRFRLPELQPVASARRRPCSRCSCRSSIRRGTSVRRTPSTATKLLDRVGLSHRLDHEPSQMSGGQQQARGDRPLAGERSTGAPRGRTDGQPRLAHRGRGAAALERLNGDEGITVILVTHDADVAAHARRTIRLHDGEVVEDVTR